MHELKRKVNNILANLNEDWTNTIRDAEKKGEGLDLAEMFSKFSRHNESLDQAFMEAEQRSKKNRGWFK